MLRLLTVGATVMVMTLTAVTPAAATAAGAVDSQDPCATADSGIGRIESFDGTSLEFSCFKPEGASASAPVPLIIRMHGFGGQYDPVGDGGTERLLAAGYGVLTYSSRGHAGSGGATWAGHPEYEARDLRTILDWAHDHAAWVEKDPESGIARDTRVGLRGGSMGSQVALIAAAQDPRIDAIVAVVAPHRLDWAVAPNDVGRTLLDVFLAISAPKVRAAPGLIEGYASFKATRRMPEDLRSLLMEISPATHVSDLVVPVFFVAGMTDNYTSLDHSLALAGVLERNGAPVKVLTDNWDHVGTPPDPRTGITELEPCGSFEPPSIKWFDRYVRRLPVDTGPVFSAALDDGTCVDFKRIKGFAPGKHQRTHDIAVPGSHFVAGVTDVPLGVTGAVLVGVPHVTMRVGGSGVGEWHLFAELVARSAHGTRSIDSQVMAFRELTAADCGEPAAGLRCVSAPIGGVGSVLRPGEELVLRLSTSSEWYWDSHAVPVTVSGIEVALPVVDVPRRRSP